jgi:hypothetical protein
MIGIIGASAFGAIGTIFCAVTIIISRNPGQSECGDKIKENKK